MHDPLEGVAPSGTITTGVSPDRVAEAFRPVLEIAAARVRTIDSRASLYVYGSVATGMAQPPTSDVDLLTIGLSGHAAAEIGTALSNRFSTVCRAVEIGAAQPNDFSADTDEGYGGLVFLKHYCVHLAGPDLHSALPEFPADVRAARGFNGDIATTAVRWRTELESGAEPAVLGRRVARKALLAVAGLVSMHDNTWTTDRATAAARWAEIKPGLADDLEMLAAWSKDEPPRSRAAVAAVVDGTVARIVDSFETTIGLWTEGPSGRG